MHINTCNLCYFCKWDNVNFFPKNWNSSQWKHSLIGTTKKSILEDRKFFRLLPINVKILIICLSIKTKVGLRPTSESMCPLPAFGNLHTNSRVPPPPPPALTSFNPLVPKDHNSECRNMIRIKASKRQITHSFLQGSFLPPN